MKGGVGVRVRWPRGRTPEFVRKRGSTVVRVRRQRLVRAGVTGSVETTARVSTKGESK